MPFELWGCFTVLTHMTGQALSHARDDSGHSASWSTKGPSALAPLRPLGIGTPFVESLSSYLMRLAITHSISTGALVRYILATHVDVLSRDTPRRDAVSSYLRVAFSMNGSGRMAQQWVDALSALTLRSDLFGLSVLAWAQVMHDRNLLVSSRRWCRACLVEWRASGAPLYEPLLWSLTTASVCPVHAISLENVCPRCGRESRWLSWWSLPSFCSACFGPLTPPDMQEAHGQGGAQSREVTQETQLPSTQNVCGAGSAGTPDQAAQVQLARTIGDWLSDTSQRAEPIPHEWLDMALRRALPPSEDGGAARFARQLDVPKVTFWGWTNARRPMALSALVAICRGLNCTVSAFLTPPETPLTDVKHHAASDAFTTPVGAFVPTPPSVAEFDTRLVVNGVDGGAFQTGRPNHAVAAVAHIQAPRLHAGRRDEQRVAAVRASLTQLLAAWGEDSPTTCDCSLTESRDNVVGLDASAHTRLPHMARGAASGVSEHAERCSVLTAREVAARLGISRRTLRAYAPDLYIQLLEDGRRARTERKRRRRASVAEQIRQAAREVVDAGDPPTARRVGLVMEKPGIFRDRGAREALSAARSEWSERVERNF